MTRRGARSCLFGPAALMLATGTRWRRSHEPRGDRARQLKQDGLLAGSSIRKISLALAVYKVPAAITM